MTKRIFRSILLVAAAVLLASFMLITGVLYDYFSNNQMEQLRAQTALAAQGVEKSGEGYFAGLGSHGTRLTWIAADGTVLYDSSANAAGMENHADREEVHQALKTGHGESMRYSTTLMERQLYSADRRYRRKRLAAKAHRADRLKTLFVAQLARGVPRERNARVLGAHAAAVVAYSYVSRAAALELDRHLSCTRVEGVFDELLYYRRRSLDDLARGDHVRNKRRKYIYPCHIFNLTFRFYLYVFCVSSVTVIPTKPYLPRTIKVRQCLPLAKLEGKVPPFGGG